MSLVPPTRKLRPEGHDLLDFLIQSAQEEGESLPPPRTFASAARVPRARERRDELRRRVAMSVEV